jgi:predicted phage terminase large subunit-like protein
LADDPQNLESIYSKAERERTNRWWFETMTTRVDDPQKSSFVIVQQRLHPEDLIGVALARDLGYEYLCLPSEFDPARRYITHKVNPDTGLKVEFQRDPRKQEGALLFEEAFSQDVLADVKKTLGSAAYAAQHQQNPSDSTNAIFKPEWWKFWRPSSRAQTEGDVKGRPVGCNDGVARPLPETFDRMVATVDCTLLGEQSKDFTVVQVWAAAGGDRFLLEQHRGKFALSQLATILMGVHSRYPLAQILIEEAVVGPAVVEDMKRSIPGVTAYKVQGEGSKEARAVSITPQVEAGNVHLPEGATWLRDFVEEFASFPGKHDDMVDCTSAALRRLTTAAAKGMPGAIPARVTLWPGQSQGAATMPKSVGIGSRRAPSSLAIVRRFR